MWYVHVAGSTMSGRTRATSQCSPSRLQGSTPLTTASRGRHRRRRPWQAASGSRTAGSSLAGKIRPQGYLNAFFCSRFWCSRIVCSAVLLSCFREPELPVLKVTELDTSTHNDSLTWYLHVSGFFASCHISNLLSRTWHELLPMCNGVFLIIQCYYYKTEHCGCWISNLWLEHTELWKKLNAFLTILRTWTAYPESN